MKVGYVHPYHSEGSPIFFSNKYFMKDLFTAVGPEQVSPHYETLSRSRRGLILFATYIASINMVSRFGGWEHNDWLRAMIWHHEFLIAFYVGFIETRHFSFFLGPKFLIVDVLAVLVHNSPFWIFEHSHHANWRPHNMSGRTG